MREDKQLVFDGKVIKNRFILGTGKFKDKTDLRRAIELANVEIVTVALRRVDAKRHQENIMEHIPRGVICMTNTSGARNAEEALRIARLARACGMGNWIKIEVISDTKYLLPDNEETVRAARMLIDEGYVVFPYVSPDLYTARTLQQIGAAAVMPLGSLIGSKSGIKAREFIKILIEEINIPIIVDAGIGNPSHAAEAMELGADACLVNTAVAVATDPPRLAEAFSLAVRAGRSAFLLEASNETLEASASSPLTGFLFENQV